MLVLVEDVDAVAEVDDVTSVPDPSEGSVLPLSPPAPSEPSDDPSSLLNERAPQAPKIVAHTTTCSP
jgi:hypothetical protein